MKNVYTKDELLDIVAWVVTAIYLPDAPRAERLASVKEVREQIAKQVEQA